MAILKLDNPTRDSDLAPVFPSSAHTISPSDTDEFDEPVTVYVGGAGNVAVIPWGGSGTAARNTPVVFNGMTAGMRVPVQVRAVRSTNTTATLLVGIY